MRGVAHVIVDGISHAGRHLPRTADFEVDSEVAPLYFDGEFREGSGNDKFLSESHSRAVRGEVAVVRHGVDVEPFRSCRGGTYGDGGGIARRPGKEVVVEHRGSGTPEKSHTGEVSMWRG